jgi:hypothetical protein
MIRSVLPKRYAALTLDVESDYGKLAGEQYQTLKKPDGFPRFVSAEATLSLFASPQHRNSNAGMAHRG